MEQLIISLLAGAAGGNATGAIFKNLNLGLLGNSVAGIVGGGLGTSIISAVAGGGVEGIIGQILSGGVGGGVLMAIVGIVKKMMAK